MQMIGVIGGVGPYAGIDFLKKIFDNTKALKDQEHVNCLLISCPSIIADRMDFLLNRLDGKAENPCNGMFESARRLHMAGVRRAIVACNAAHSGRIFSPFCEKVKEQLPDLEIVNLLESCAEYVKASLPGLKRIGLLATMGAHSSRVYHEYIKKEDGFILMEPDAAGQDRVHSAIFSEEYGIKAHSKNITQKAQDLIAGELKRLIEQGAEAVIMGCTEIPLAVKPEDYSIPVLDPGLIAARKLLRMTFPEKLLD